VKLSKLNPKLQWRPQEVRDARNVEHLRKAASSEQRQPKREAVRAVSSKAIGAVLPKPFGTRILLPCALDARHGAIGFIVCHAGFHFALVRLLIVTFLFLPFGMECVGTECYDLDKQCSPNGSCGKGLVPTGGAIER
jgi:hypothetical protein